MSTEWASEIDFRLWSAAVKASLGSVAPGRPKGIGQINLIENSTTQPGPHPSESHLKTLPANQTILSLLTAQTCRRYFWSMLSCLWVTVLNLSHYNKSLYLALLGSCEDLLPLRRPPRLPLLSHADQRKGGHPCPGAPSMPGLGLGTMGLPRHTRHTPWERRH